MSFECFCRQSFIIPNAPKKKRKEKRLGQEGENGSQRGCDPFRKEGRKEVYFNRSGPIKEQ
jgi:hypothetical protein